LLPLALLAATLLPAPALLANERPAGSINDEIRADMADARREVRADLAVARAELETDNLELGQNLRFGRSDQSGDDASPLPKAEITPRGDFLIDGEAVAIDARQRKELLAYRGQVRSEEHTSELQSRENLVCRLLLEKKNSQHLPTAG